MKSALIFYGGWDGHQPRECAELFSAKLAAKNFNVEVSDTLDVLDDAKRLSTFSLIVPMWTCGTLSAEREKNLCAAILGGTGLGGFHGGMGDAFRGSIGFQWMVGGQFVAHPDNIKDFVVQVVNRNDPITAGIDSFRVRTEQYYMLVDPRNEVLATSTIACASAPWANGVVMPAIWKKVHGAGRIFYSSFGHVAEEFVSTPELMQITLNGLEWASRGPS